MSGRRIKPRSGLFKRAVEPASAAVLQAETDERQGIRYWDRNMTHVRIAAAEIEAEGLKIVEEVYQRHGLPTGPGARWRAFRTTDGWHTWEGPLSGYHAGPDDDLALWADLGDAVFGVDSEAGFASSVARTIEPLHREGGAFVERDDNWLAGFIAGFALGRGAERHRWEWSPERRAIVDPRAPERRAEGGRVRAAGRRDAMSPDERRRVAIWQEIADEVWKRHPDRSAQAVAEDVRRELRRRGATAAMRAANTIRQAIKKADG